MSYKFYYTLLMLLNINVTARDKINCTQNIIIPINTHINDKHNIIVLNNTHCLPI